MIQPIYKQNGTPYKILVAEDVDVNQLMARYLLESMGCEVELVSNGQEAMEKAANDQYDVIFMDCEMPVVDGYQATRAIKLHEQTSNSTHKHTPIIALTAKVFSQDRQKCLDAGMDDYLPKPIRRESVTEMIDKWCKETVPYKDQW